MKAVGRTALAALALMAPGGAWGQAPAFPRDSIDHLIAAEMRRQHIPGLSVAVLRGDSILLSRGYGLANVELGAAASPATMYQSGSVGKQFTAALVLMLAEEGRLGIDDPILRYLPEGRRRWTGVTVRHLLTHSSGIPDYTDGVVDLRRDYSEDQLVGMAATIPMAFPPGRRWSYSNTGYLLLGVIIHRVTGRFYGDLLRDILFLPLNMPSARVISEADIVPGRAAGYRLEGEALKNQEWVAPALNTTADGSLYLSLLDYQRWAVALNHAVRPSRRVLEQAWTPVTLRGGGTYPYGAGWFLLPQRGHARVGHTGSWQGFQTSIQRYPEADLTVVVLSNLGGSRPGPLSMAIAGIIDPTLQAPHMLVRKARPDPDALRIGGIAGGLAAGTEDTTSITAGLRDFVSPAWRRELRDELHGVVRWEPLSCDEGPAAFQYLGAVVERTCYARGTGDAAAVLATVYFSGDHRVAGIETYDF